MKRHLSIRFLELELLKDLNIEQGIMNAEVLKAFVIRHSLFDIRYGLHFPLIQWINFIHIIVNLSKRWQIL